MKRSIYIALLPLVLVGFVSEGAAYMLIPSLPDISASLGLTKSQGSSLLAIYYLVHSITFLFAGVAGDRFDKKRLLLAASSFIFAGSLLLGFGNTYIILATGRVLQAFGAAIVVVVAQSWIGQSSSQTNITRLFSYLAIVMSFAPLIAPIIGGIVNDSLGWRYSFYFVAALALVAICLLLFAVAPPPPEHRGHRRALSTYKYLLLKTPLTAMVATMLVCSLFQGALMSYSSFFAIEEFGLSSSAFGFISVPIVAGIIIGQLPVVRFEKRRGLGAAYTFNSAVAIIALGFSLIFEQTIYSLAAVLFVFNIGFGGHTLIATRTVLGYFASERSYSSALMNFMGDFTNYLAALLVQLLFLFIGSSAMIHNIVCVVTIILIALCYLLFKRKITDFSVLR